MDQDFELEQEANRKKVKAEYYEFLTDFRDFIAEYVRESVVELTITEIPVKDQVKLFDGYTPGKARIKNQGAVTCYIGTSPQGGFRLDPNETVEFFVNRSVFATTLSGMTTLGFVHS